MYEKAMQPEPKGSLAMRFYDAELSHLPIEIIHEFVSEIRVIAKQKRDERIEKGTIEIREAESALKSLASLQY